MLTRFAQASAKAAYISRAPITINAFRAYRPSVPRTSVDDNFEENLRTVQQKVDQEKQKVLHGLSISPVENAPGWNEQLASASEIVIKAEREPYKNFDELRRETLVYFDRVRDNDGTQSDLMSAPMDEAARHRFKTSVDDNWQENLRVTQVMIDLEKERSLNGNVVSTVSHAPGWSEALADESEIVVKAEREPRKSFEDLRAESVKIIDRKRQGMRPPPKTSVDDNFEENLRVAQIKLELEKQRSLNGAVVTTIPHADGWSEELADESEVVVKAEREPTKSIDELRDHSVKVLQRKRRDYPGSGPMYRAKPTSLDDNAEENLRVAKARLENEKRRSLSGNVKSTIKSAPKWSENLATESEVSVKADQQRKQNLSSLRRQSVKVLQQQDKQSRSSSTDN